MVTDKTTVTGEGIAPLMLENKTLSIKAGERFKITTPDGLVSEAGVRELSDYLACNSLGALPPDFEPIWTTKRGTLPKRLASHIYKTHKLKMSEAQVSAIGNIARRNSSVANTYHCDFTKRIDWRAGDFGDHGSCAWGDKAGMKDMVSENGYALRFFRGEGSEGYGRAWIAPIEGNRLICFNAYGLEPITVARILSVHFACGYKRISLANNGSDCGVLWINGGSAYVLGAWDKIESVTSWNLDWEEVDAEENHVACVACDDDLGERDDNDQWAYDRYGDTVPCCESCSFECERCNERFAEDCERRDNGNSYCRACRDEIVHERERKAQERAEEIERLEKKIGDLVDQKDDLQSQIDDIDDEIDDAKSELENLREEGE